MVEVTKSNFEEKLPLIEQAINESCFVAIDTEFTGLDVDSSRETSFSLFDNLETRYQKLKVRASSFIPCQIGLSMFKRDKTENKYLVETYVFYVRPYLCGSADKRFMIQASSLDFLCRYDFDFNKFIKDGIPYINEDEAVQLRKEISEKTVGYESEKLMEFKTKREMDILINNTFLNSTQDVKSHLPMKSQEEKSKPKRLTLKKETIIHEYFQVNELRRKYPSLWIYVDDDKIVVENSFPEKKELQELLKDEEERFVDFYLGFTKVFRHLRASNKIIVGHNLLTDLMLFFHNFYKPLPRTYKEFKKELHGIFPVILDTRHIWLHVKKFYKLKEIPTRCGLFDLLEMFQNPTDSLCTLYSPHVEHTNCDKYGTGEFPHESGYDSYVTGWVFLKICHVLALNNITNTLFVQPQTFKQHITAVRPFANKVNLSHSNIRYIDLAENDPTPKESQLLHISVRNKNKVLNHVELSRLLDKYGMIEFKLSKNRREAVLAVGTLRSFREILKDFQNEPDFAVSKYNVLKHSPVVNSALWLTSLGVCSIAAFYAVKLWSHS